MPASRARLRALLAPALAFTTSFALSACSALVTFDGLVGGAPADAATLPDATSPAADGGADSAGTDATTTPDGADAAQPPFCATVMATFCDDFERSAGVQGAWTQVRTGGAGAAVTLISDAQGHHAHAEVGGGGVDSRHANLELDLPPSTSKLKLRWKMRVPAVTPSDLYAEPMTVALAGSAQGYRQILLAVNGATESLYTTSSSFEDGGKGPGDSHPVAFTRGTWQELSLTIDFGAGTSTMAVNGAQGVSEAIPVVFTPAAMSLRIGVNYIGTSGSMISPLAVDFDDVALTYQ